MNNFQIKGREYLNYQISPHISLNCQTILSSFFKLSDYSDNSSILLELSDNGAIYLKLSENFKYRVALPAILYSCKI